MICSEAALFLSQCFGQTEDVLLGIRLRSGVDAAYFIFSLNRKLSSPVLRSGKLTPKDPILDEFINCCGKVASGARGPYFSVERHDDCLVQFQE